MGAACGSLFELTQRAVRIASWDWHEPVDTSAEPRRREAAGDCLLGHRL